MNRFSMYLELHIDNQPIAIILPAILAIKTLKSHAVRPDFHCYIYQPGLAIPDPRYILFPFFPQGIRCI